MCKNTCNHFRMGGGKISVQALVFDRQLYSNSLIPYKNEYDQPVIAIMSFKDIVAITEA